MTLALITTANQSRNPSLMTWHETNRVYCDFIYEYRTPNVKSTHYLRFCYNYRLHLTHFGNLVCSRLGQSRYIIEQHPNVASQFSLLILKEDMLFFACSSDITPRLVGFIELLQMMVFSL